jgi:hypothetical protein
MSDSCSCMPVPLVLHVKDFFTAHRLLAARETKEAVFSITFTLYHSILNTNHHH